MVGVNVSIKTFNISASARCIQAAAGSQSRFCPALNFLWRKVGRTSTGRVMVDVHVISDWLEDVYLSLLVETRLMMKSN